MSLYQCIDLIENRLHTLQNVSFKGSLEKDILEELKGLLQERELTENYFNLDFELKIISDFKLNNKFNLILERIYDDLTIINANVNFLNSNYLGDTLDEKLDDFLEKSHPHQKILTSFKERRVAKIANGLTYRSGNSGGECAGFVKAMVDPRFSPYLHKKSIVHLNRDIYNYQKNQLNRLDDQKIIKYVRLTRLRFEPNVCRQAKKMLQFAEKHIDQDLNIRLLGKNVRHRIYLRVQENGKIRFMNPSFDAYLFESKEEFIRFYMATSFAINKKFHFYQIGKLIYDPYNRLNESYTLKGKLRSLLTGPKYLDKQFTFYLNLFYLISGLCIASIALGSIVILFGSGLLGGCALFLMGSGVVFAGITFGLGISFIQYKAYQAKNRGLLSVIHYLKDIWHDFASPKSEQPAIEKDWSNNSSAFMLTYLRKHTLSKFISSDIAEASNPLGKNIKHQKCSNNLVTFSYSKNKSENSLSEHLAYPKTIFQL